MTLSQCFKVRHLILGACRTVGFQAQQAFTVIADEGCEIRLAGFRYKIDPLICGICRNALKSASTLPGLMEFVRLATRPGSDERN